MAKKPTSSRARAAAKPKRPRPAARAKPKARPAKTARSKAPAKPAPATPAQTRALTQRDTARQRAREFAIAAARLLADDKCEDIVVFDLSAGLSQTQDFIVIATGTSDRQMRSCADDLGKLGQSMGYQLFRRSLDDGTTWVVADFVDVVAHVFEPNTRAYYDLETMWGDAPRVDWQTGRGPAPRARVG